MAPRLLRSLAILIALLGVIDPAVVRSRPAPATVAVVTPSGSTAQTAALADRVAAAIDGHYQVTRSRSALAAAVVAVGDRLLDDADAVVVPSIAVVGDPPAVRLTAVTAPARASLADRVQVSTSLVVSGAAGRTLEVTLHGDNIAVDRTTRTIAGADERLQIPLTFVPASEGVAKLRVTARLDSSIGAADEAVADLAITIDRHIWPVFVFARRPSWMSTFVSRVLEDDPRFSVTARTMTSAAGATMTPESPASVSDAIALSKFAAIIVAAPETLTTADVNGLESYLRRRGGAVIALYDSAPEAVPHAIDGLLHVRAWRSEITAAPAVLAASGLPALEATETTWPAELPAGAEVLAEPGTRSILWQVPVGAGRVVVSGALDSWRYRESATSAFREFWRRTIATAASASPEPIEIAIEHPLVGINTAPTARVVLRDLALAPDAAGQSVSIAATVDGPSGRAAVRLWPDAAPGTFHATLPASSQTGVYRLTVTSVTNSAAVSWTVAAQAIAPNPDERALVDQWAHSRGGTTIAASALGTLAGAIDRVLSKPRQDTRWHPMRQAWWIAPFALVLGCEWWLRRRR